MTDDLERVRALAGPLLAEAPTRGAEGVAAFAPRSEDFARIFTDTVAPAMEAHFQALWVQRPAITTHPGQTALQIWTARAEELAAGVPGFPGGYKALAPYLNPGVIWIAWKYSRPGMSAGMAYDGLVRIDDRFAWFPKPWRVLKDVKPSLEIYTE